MWLVISEPYDTSALWAYEKLKKDLEPLELITSGELSYFINCTYEINSTKSEFEFVLYDKKKIQSNDIKGIINRFTYLHTEHIDNSKDASYVKEELHAFFIGWMSSLNIPIINTPVPFNYSGKWRHLSQWIYLASKAGLNTPKYIHVSDTNNIENTFDSDKQRSFEITVLDDEVIDTNSLLSESQIEGCIKLGELSQTRLLGVEFIRENDVLIFSNATPSPDFINGGETIIKKFKDILKGDK